MVPPLTHVLLEFRFACHAAPREINLGTRYAWRFGHIGFIQIDFGQTARSIEKIKHADARIRHLVESV